MTIQQTLVLFAAAPVYSAGKVHLCLLFTFFIVNILSFFDSLCPIEYLFYFILFYFILFYLILILILIILFYFILFYFILFYFILFYFILFYFILFYFIFSKVCVRFSLLCKKRILSETRSKKPPLLTNNITDLQHSKYH